MSKSLKDQILSTPFLRERRPVSVPSWPGTEGKLFIQNLSAHEHERYVSLVTRDSREDVCLYAEVAVLTLVDENGQKVFAAEDVAGLAAGDPDPVETIFSAFIAFVNERNDAKKKPVNPPSAPNTPSP